MTMHVMTSRPHCWTDPFDFPPASLEPRPGCDWCFDQGASCGNHRSLAQSDRELAFTPGCRGCSRLLRNLMLEDGRAKAHEHRVGRKVAA